MKVSEFLHPALTLWPGALAGLLLGAFFYGGLWWTVRRGVSSPNAALWFVGSMLVRTIVVLGGFYLVAGGDWKRWLATLAGFVVARLLVARITRPPRDGAAFSPEARHAS
jgi:F1F0 ATPase subunit 2